MTDEIVGQMILGGVAGVTIGVIAILLLAWAGNHMGKR